MQVFTKNGKNSADIKITIDVMKELARGVAVSFALVSSDSDFSHLAQEIRANGCEAIIFADKDKATERLRNSCDKFIPFLNILPKKDSTQNSAQKPTQIPKNATKSDSKIREILTKALQSEYLHKKSDDEGFCNAATIGTFLKDHYKVELRADFDATSWKSLFGRFPDLFESKFTGNKNSTLKIRLTLNK